jgi:hypothetical protein
MQINLIGHRLQLQTHASWLVGCLVGWLVGWLAGWLASWLAGGASICRTISQ